MSTSRDRLTRRAAERILDHQGDPREAVARLVDAAAAAAPVAGEDQAATLFRAATSLVPVPAAGASAMRRVTRKLAALPVAGVAAGVLALGGGGLALAATQGAVNVPFTGHDNRSDHAPDAPSSSNPGLSRTPGAPGSPAATHLPSASPSPSLEGLCHAYQAGAVPRKASNPAFAALTSAAGSAEGVGGYCTGLIGTPTRPAHPTPTHPAPSATPTHPAPDHATTPPVTRPTEADSPSLPPKPRPVSPTTPPRPTEAAHE